MLPRSGTANAPYLYMYGSHVEVCRGRIKHPYTITRGCSPGCRGPVWNPSEIRPIFAKSRNPRKCAFCPISDSLVLDDTLPPLFDPVSRERHRRAIDGQLYFSYSHP